MNTTPTPQAVEQPRQWERIQSGTGKDRHTVYWNAPLPDGGRAAVGRIYTSDGKPTTQWHWKVWAPRPQGSNAWGDPVAMGSCANVHRGKRLVESYLREHGGVL